MYSFAFIFLTTLFCCKFASGQVAYYGPLTSCLGKVDRWKKGSGPEIRLWTQSILPVLNDSGVNPIIDPPNLYGDFSMFNDHEYWQEVRETRLRLKWSVFGPEPYDGWLYGRFDPSTKKFVGNKVAYIYHDLQTVIIGKFVDGELQYGRPAKVKAYRCNSGIMELQFTKPKKNSPVFKYEQPTEKTACSQHTVMDPFEKRHIYVAEQSIPNIMVHSEGIFAKTNFLPFSLVSVYAGVFIPNTLQLTFENMTEDEKDDINKNLMSYNETHIIDIPPALTPIHKYRASLGHKANCVITSEAGLNAQYFMMKHPYFGHVRCIRSTRAIKKGEEILVDYGYSIEGDGAPRWYRKLHEDLKQQAEVSLVEK